MGNASIASLRALGQTLIIFGAGFAVITIVLAAVTPVSPLLFIACAVAVGGFVIAAAGIILRGLALHAAAVTNR